MASFKPFSPQQNLPATEEQILALWQDQKIFPRSVLQRQGSKPFVFYEGPPTANGKPGIHHVMARTFKDTICRYQTMKGRYVKRRAGWDTHGLPVELQVEKSLGLKNKQDIEKYGVAEFNRQCRQSVWQFKEDWERLTERIGYWADLDDAYITYDNDYIQSVWWGFKQIWDKNKVYQDYKVVPYCFRCGTALSLAEVAQGYKDTEDTSVYIKFKLTDEEAYILAWTTTPWTLPGNVALAINPAIVYVKVKQNDEIYYLAKDRLAILKDSYQVLEELPADQLVGRHYQPLFDFIDLGHEAGKDAYRLLAADFVTTEDGTGVVHTAVMYGEEDFNLGKATDLPAIHTVDETGRFNQLVIPWAGQLVKESESAVIEYLEAHQLLYKTEVITHSYPFCWRCDNPLLYYARSAWFIRIDDQLRQRLVELNQDIKWVPDHIKDGRFGNWLSGLRDWSISRERYWGTPMPIWRCQAEPTHQVCLDSLETLRNQATPESRALIDEAGESVDLHKPFLDQIELECQSCQSPMKRVPEVLDVWFDSGSMPFAQWGYPRINQDQFKDQFPADYISEAIDQTRGWFNSLLIISTIIFDKAAYKSVITGNLVLDENGRKMSKSKGNVVDPWQVIGETGVDALRLYFLTVNQPGEYKNFSIKAVTEVNRKTVMIWWNVVNYFLTYAELANWQPGQTSQPILLDQWIVARLDQATGEIDQALTNLDTFTAARQFQAYIDDLSTWYLRRSRKRTDLAFYQTMHQVLLKTAGLAAPMMPFIAEATYQALKTEDQPDSIHLTDFPVPEGTDQAQLLAKMAAVRELVTLGHAARVEASLKVRQPLQEVRVSSGSTELDQAFLDILAEELNVKTAQLGKAAGPDWVVKEQSGLTLALNTAITPELKAEGLVRDLTREIQELRKKAGCRPGQQVRLSYQTESQTIKDLLDTHRQQLAELVFVTLEQGGEGPAEAGQPVTIDGQRLSLQIIND